MYLNAVFAHVKALALQRLGVIQYEAKLGAVMRPIWTSNQAAYLHIVEAIVRDLEDLDD